MSNWPALPVSREAIGLAIQMFALYWSVRMLRPGLNPVTVVFVLLLIGINAGMIIYHLVAWYGLPR